ncbi:hypothetical protein [Streptomyces sp. NPDC048720]|uniref:hypothetical protein n=1 Tax=Streptomyces sp. NPDC048720 TaxID=3365588 RepID=UPI0037147835
MGREAARDAVELTYRPAAGDFTSALRARLRLSGRGRFQLWGPYALGLLLVAEVIAVAAGADGVAPAPMAGLALGAVVMALAPWLQARQFVRLTERQGAAGCDARRLAAGPRSRQTPRGAAVGVRRYAAPARSR